MTRFHGIPVSDPSIFPQWMHDQKPVMVFTLRKGTEFIGFASDGDCKRFRLGEKHNAPFVYHTVEVETGQPNCIGQSALVWPVGALAAASPCCRKCGDPLIGHEDETSTHCRWCVTCTDPTQHSNRTQNENRAM